MSKSILEDKYGIPPRPSSIFPSPSTSSTTSTSASSSSSHTSSLSKWFSTYGIFLPLAVIFALAIHFFGGISPYYPSSSRHGGGGGGVGEGGFGRQGIVKVETTKNRHQTKNGSYGMKKTETGAETDGDSGERKKVKEECGERDDVDNDDAKASSVFVLDKGTDSDEGDARENGGVGTSLRIAKGRRNLIRIVVDRRNNVLKRIEHACHRNPEGKITDAEIILVGE